MSRVGRDVRVYVTHREVYFQQRQPISQLADELIQVVKIRDIQCVSQLMNFRTQGNKEGRGVRLGHEKQ